MHVIRSSKHRRKRMSQDMTPVGTVSNSVFEEQIAIFYLHNTILSPLLNRKLLEILAFARDVLGSDVLCEATGTKHTLQNVSEQKTKETVGIGAYEAKALLRGPIMKILRQGMPRKASLTSDGLVKRLSSLQSVFKLDSTEIAILRLFHMVTSCEVLNTHLCNHDGVGNFMEFNRLKMYGDHLLGLPKGSVGHALTRGTLFRMDMINTNIGDLPSSLEFSLSWWATEYLVGLGGDDLQSGYFSTDNDNRLSLCDFTMADTDVSVIDTLIESPGRQNILFHGVPGTGKTSIAKCFASRHGKALFTVKMKECGDNQDRLRFIRVTMNCAPEDSSLILVDEADELLNSESSPLHRGNVSKGFINDLIEGHNHKVIWITNRISEIDPSTLRRFSHSVEFGKFDTRSRIKVLSNELRKRKLQHYMTSDETRVLCETYRVNAGGVVDAVNMLEMSGSMGRDAALKNMRTVLSRHEQITTGKRPPVVKRVLSDYCIEGLNMNIPPQDIVEKLARYTRHCDGAPECYRTMALLFHGPPGTGKTEFAHYLARELGFELCARRCSDIVSPFVGETEQRIAEAFHETAESEGILLFDEADSFLFPRRDAVRSWERSSTNEFLTQLESHRGIVICATNDIDGLDHAALRRFRLKVHFRVVTPQGILLLYRRMLGPLVSDDCSLNELQVQELCGMSGLTPGDFAVVRDQFFGEAQEHVTHDVLVQALACELLYRRNRKPQIGFMRCESHSD